MNFSLNLSQFIKNIILDIIQIKKDILEHENIFNKNSNKYNSVHKIRHKNGQVTIAEYNVKSDSLKIFCLKDEKSLKEDVSIKLKLHD